MARQSPSWLVAYYAVPMSGSAITAFRQQIIERWRRAIRRRSQIFCIRGLSNASWSIIQGGSSVR
jgi:hypothetical protein